MDASPETGAKLTPSLHIFIRGALSQGHGVKSEPLYSSSLLQHHLMQAPPWLNHRQFKDRYIMTANDINIG